MLGLNPDLCYALVIVDLMVIPDPMKINLHRRPAFVVWLSEVV